MNVFQISRRYYHITRILCQKTNNIKLKGRKSSSQQWLLRQLNDPYVDRAKMLNYRCRSAFKLIEIDEKYNILKPGSVIIDCGAAPGSWSQYCVQRANSRGWQENNPKGTVIAVDKQPIFPIDGATILSNCNITNQQTLLKIKETLNNTKPNVILSDMAPNSSGIKSLDDENMKELCYIVLGFAINMSAQNGTILLKLWQSNYTKLLQEDILKYYSSVKIVKPLASRSDSAEIYLLGRGFNKSSTS